MCCNGVVDNTPFTAVMTLKSPPLTDWEQMSERWANLVFISRMNNSGPSMTVLQIHISPAHYAHNKFIPIIHIISLFPSMSTLLCCQCCHYFKADQYNTNGLMFADGNLQNQLMLVDTHRGFIVLPH